MQRVPQVTNRVDGLDSLRFICALWVFFSHGAAPLVFPFPLENPTLASVMRGIQGNLWVGVAAVIVFFIISGFCIHFPFAGSLQRPVLREFYARRFVRLLIPLAIAFPVTALLSSESPLSGGFPLYAIIWSVVAELIYYLIYPVIRALHLRARSWWPLIAAAYGGSCIVALTDPGVRNYHGYGVGLTWVLGLPCWLLGCALADRVRNGELHVPALGTIWSLRITVAVTASMCSVLRFHSPVGYPWTLNVFALLATYWVWREIGYRSVVPPVPVVERAGVWSYSLYLLHPGVLVFLDKVSAGNTLGWTRLPMKWGSVLLLSYLFYLIVERPSHNLARYLAGWLRPQRQVGSAPAVIGAEIRG